MTIRTGVCAPWATPDDMPENLRENLDPSLIGVALLAASNELFWLSGRQFPGVCTDTVRPSSRSLSMDHGRPLRAPNQGVGWFPGPVNGEFSPWGFCGCNRTERTGCSSIPEVTLGAYPVVSVTEVKIDGLVVDPATYRVDDDRWLVRLADVATRTNPGWPCCQRDDLPPTEVGTWSVTFRYGTAPPPPGDLAAIELAYQFALALDPASAGMCRLPDNVINMVRQGETVAALDPMALIRDGFLGLTLCDRFIKGTNPAGIDRRAVVLSPDLGRRVRR